MQIRNMNMQILLFLPFFSQFFYIGKKSTKDFFKSLLKQNLLLDNSIEKIKIGGH